MRRGYKRWLVRVGMMGLIVLQAARNIVQVSLSTTYPHNTDRLLSLPTAVNSRFSSSEYVTAVPDMEPEITTTQHQNSSLHFLTTEESGGLFYDPENQSCDTMEHALQQDQVIQEYPHHINALRRHLMMNDYPCFQKLLPYFVTAFQSRLALRHVMLHIPKAGGTSVCSAARNSRIKNSGRNCYTGYFCPLWCCCDDPKPTTCEKLKEKQRLDFQMNENWLDTYCPSMMYSMLLREPIARAMSHVNHLHKHPKKEQLPWRIAMTQSNYMTWALTAYQGARYDQIGTQNPDYIRNWTILYHNNQHPREFRPRKEDLPMAKERLLQMDFLVDLQHSDKQCINKISKLIHIHKKMEHKNKAEKGNYQESFNVTDFARWNQLDVQLYNFSQTFIELDCQFLSLVEQMQTSDTSVAL